MDRPGVHNMFMIMSMYTLMSNMYNDSKVFVLSLRAMATPSTVVGKQANSVLSHHTSGGYSSC